MRAERRQIADYEESHEELVGILVNHCPPQPQMLVRSEPPHHLVHVAKTNRAPHHHATTHHTPNQNHQMALEVNQNQMSQS